MDRRRMNWQSAGPGWALGARYPTTRQRRAELSSASDGSLHGERATDGQHMATRGIQAPALPLCLQTHRWLSHGLVGQAEGPPVHGDELARPQVLEGARRLFRIHV